MKVIVKDHIIETSLIKEMSVWGSLNYNDWSSDLDEIGVFIEYYKDRNIPEVNDLIILGYVGKDVSENKRLLKEANSIVEFIESHKSKLDYPVFE